MTKEISVNLKSLQCATANWWLLHALNQDTFSYWDRTLKSCFSTLKWMVLVKVWLFLRMRSTCSLLEMKRKSISGILEPESAWAVSQTQVASTQRKLPWVLMANFLPPVPKWAQSTCFTSQQRLSSSAVVPSSRSWTWQPRSLTCSSITQVKCSLCAQNGKRTRLDLPTSHLTPSFKTSPESPQVFWSTLSAWNSVTRASF